MSKEKEADFTTINWNTITTIVAATNHNKKKNGDGDTAKLKKIGTRVMSRKNAKLRHVFKKEKAAMYR